MMQARKERKYLRNSRLLLEDFYAIIEVKRMTSTIYYMQISCFMQLSELQHIESKRKKKGRGRVEVCPSTVVSLLFPLLVLL